MSIQFACKTCGVSLNDAYGYNAFDGSVDRNCIDCHDKSGNDSKHLMYMEIRGATRAMIIPMPYDGCVIIIEEF